MDYGFFPDAKRAELVDAQVRGGLAASLDAAFAVLGEPVFQSLGQAIRSHPIRPGVMALYGDLMPAIAAQDEARLAELTGQLALPCWRAAANFRVVTLDDAELGTGMAECYRHHIQDDPENMVLFSAVDDAALRDGRRRIDDALTLLAAAAPALRAEISVLIHEIILIKGEAGPDALAFHGASSFFLWGALALNLAEHGGRVKLVEGIVHEAAHCLLHGVALGSTLTVNATDDRHASPLREDLRPMEGLVHAGYVLARMHLAMGALLAPGLLAGGYLTAAEQAEAANKYEAAARNFRDANETITACAEFTPVGRELFIQAQNYMRMAETNIAV